MFHLQNEVARRGGFNINYVPVFMGETETRTSFLSRVVPYVDIVGSASYVKTPDRRAKSGLGFFASIQDGSYILLTTAKEPNRDFFFFLEPFTKLLWAFLVVAVLLNGIVHWMLDRSHFMQKKTRLLFFLSVLKSTYRSAGVLTASSDMKPKTAVSALLVLGYGLFVYLLIAAYTANMAAVLVWVPPPILEVNSISEANTKKMPICMMPGTPASAAVSSMYPSIQRIEPNVPFGTLVQMLHSGTCKGIVVQEAEAMYMQVSKAYNPNCDLTQVGDPFYHSQASWVYSIKHDFSKCNYILDSVISTIIAGMKDDGTFEKLEDASIAQYNTAMCYGRTNEEASAGLNKRDLAGIFLIYGCAFAFLTGWEFVILMKKSIWRKPVGPSDESLEPAMEARMTEAEKETDKPPTGKSAPEGSWMQGHLDFFYSTVPSTFSSGGWLIGDSKPAGMCRVEDLSALQKELEEQRAKTQALETCFTRFVSELSEAELVTLNTAGVVMIPPLEVIVHDTKGPLRALPKARK